jgi:hypothetical protein
MLNFHGNDSGVQAESTRLKGFRLKVGVPSSEHFSLQPIYLGSYQIS